jgi:peptide/nickel transport system ATP-binding protein
MALLEVENLVVTLNTSRGKADAVRDISFSLEKGETLGIVGESGCGKSITALSLIGLLPEGAETSGEVRMDGTDLLALSEREMCNIRGNRIAMVFQEPMTSLNPVHTIGRQIIEPLRLHRKIGLAEAREQAVRLLDRVGLPNPAQRLDSFPHQISGGQRQRVMIAIALSCSPEILIADEPTTALDVTIQGQILDLIADLVEEMGMALILISHDLGVIGESVDRMMVMYGGAVIETGATDDLFRHLAHPYSQGLFSAIPRLGVASHGRLKTIPGTVPDLIDLPAGCGFAGRCELAERACVDNLPKLEEVDPGHFAACLRLEAALKAAKTGL